MSGGGRSPDGLAAAVYDQLKRVSARLFATEPAGHTLQPTALVHEAFLRLEGQDRAEFRNDEHFIAVASTMMRRVLVDHARARAAQKRWGDLQRTSIPDDLAVTDRSLVDLLALEAALEKLHDLDPEMVRLIELRFFGGLTEIEAARVLGVSDRKARGDWAWARGWLRKELGTPPGA